MNWQPIETAPKDMDVLVFCPEGVCTKVFVAYAHMADGWLTPEDGGVSRISGDPTHWMPLPDPPQSAHDLAQETRAAHAAFSELSAAHRSRRARKAEDAR